MDSVHLRGREIKITEDDLKDALLCRVGTPETCAYQQAEPPTSRRSRARAVVEAARPSPSTSARPSPSTAARPFSSTPAPAPPSAPEPTYLLVQHLLRFMERFERRVMRRLDHLDQAAASQGIELPPLPESSASDEQDQEEEHGAEPTQQEAPPMTQTTTEVQQPPEVQHDIPEPQPVPPPVPQPEPEHEPQPGACGGEERISSTGAVGRLVVAAESLRDDKNNESMKAFKRARKASTAENISAKAAGEGSSQVQSKPAVPSSPRARKVIPTPRVRLVDPPPASVATSGAPPNKK
nr:protein TsetseEP-like [Arachis hypogaea]